jgi:hypothetical protein
MDAAVMTDADAVKVLLAKVDQLPADKQGFARDLVKGYYRYGNWTEKQARWGHRLAHLANGETPVELPKVENLAGLVEMFDRAAAKTKWPKLTFDESAAGVPLQLGRAGPNAGQPGSVNCTDGGRYGSNRWYGRVERSGTFVPSNDCPAELIEFLKLLAGDTANVAAMYGKRTGCCCACNTPLTDARSVEIGYGPVCAKKFGWPYPTKAEFEGRPGKKKRKGGGDAQLSLAA